MKILMVNKFLHANGGSETYIFRIGEELTRLGHEVQYFGMNHPERLVGNKKNYYTESMDFHTSRWKKLIYPFKIIYSHEAYYKIYKLLAEFEPDIIHLNNFNFQLTPSIIYAIKKYKKKKEKRVKIFFTAHDYQWICPNHMLYIPQKNELCTSCIQGKYSNCVKNRCIHNSFVKSILGMVEAKLYRLLGTYKMIDLIICPSQFMKNMLSVDCRFNDRCVVMHNFFNNKPEFEEKPIGGYVLYFGRYSEEKGIRTLIYVCNKLQDIPFIFAGNGPLENEVEACSNIKNVGFIKGDELIQTIKNARFAVFPSEWYENCPFSVMEAQLYGTPVLGAAIGGTPELIQDQVTGELFESGNRSDLKQKLTDLWYDEERCRRYAENCSKICFDTLEEYAAKLVELYRQTDENTVK